MPMPREPLRESNTAMSRSSRCSACTRTRLQVPDRPPESKTAITFS